MRQNNYAIKVYEFRNQLIFSKNIKITLFVVIHYTHVGILIWIKSSYNFKMILVKKNVNVTNQR